MDINHTFAQGSALISLKITVINKTDHLCQNEHCCNACGPRQVRARTEDLHRRMQQLCLGRRH